MKRLACITAAASLIAGCADSPAGLVQDDLTPAYSAIAMTDNQTVPLALVVYIPCALDGAGEYASLTGGLHILTHATYNEAGGVTVKSHFQPQNLGGTGLTSGDQYRGTGVTQETDTYAPGGLPVEFTYVNNYRMIGQGAGNNYMVHQTVHVTVDANGNVRASVDNSSITCS